MGIRLRHGNVSKFLLAIGVVLLIIGTPMLYARSQIFNADNFANNAASALEDEATNQYLATKVVDNVIQASPDLIAAKPLLESVASEILRSEAFRVSFEAAVEDAHKTVFSSERTVILNLSDVSITLLGTLSATNPEISDQIPVDAQANIVKFSEQNWATDFIATAEKIRFMGIILPLLAILVLAGSVIVARDRRSGFIRAGIAASIAAILVILISIAIKIVVLTTISDPPARDAASSVWDAIFGGFVTWHIYIALIGAVITGAATSILKPVDINEKLSEISKRIITRPKKVWHQILRAVAILLVGILTIAEWQAVAQIVLLLVGAYLVFFGSSELLRLTVDKSSKKALKQSKKSAKGRSRYMIIGLSVALLVGILIVLLSSEDTSKPPINACNGHSELCERTLDNVSFASSHNAMSAADQQGWFFPNQEVGIREQLDFGIRGLLIDTHYGVKKGDGVKTDISELGEDQAELTETFGEETVQAAERLGGQLGLTEEEIKDRQPYLCHQFCELGYLPLEDELKDITNFLETNPNEVIVIFIEDYISGQDTQEAFDESGLLKYVYTHEENSAWPTLRQLIEQDERVLVLAEKKGGSPAWYHDGFSLVQENPFSNPTPSSFNCEPNRGPADAPLFQLNHWASEFPPKLSLAPEVNSEQSIVGHASSCKKQRNTAINLVNLDFATVGDILSSVDKLNNVADE